MRKLNNLEKALLESMPQQSADKINLIGRIRKYRSECGCSMGAKFLIAAIVVVVLYFVVINGGSKAGILWNGLACLLFIFFAGAAGKLIGIGIARLRLRILLKSEYKKIT